MKAHISEDVTKLNRENERLTGIVQARLLEFHQKGLAEGSKAMAGVVYEKATDTSKSYEERINDIIGFCKTGLKIKTDERKEKNE